MTPTLPPGVQNLGLLSQLVMVYQGVQPANSVFISPEDTLYLLVWPSVAATLQINLRILAPDGQVVLTREQYTTAPTRSPQVTVFQLGQGVVLSATINGYAVNSLHRGACYAALFFLRGSITVNPNFTQTLCSGYVTAQKPLIFPYGEVEDSFAGRGNIRSITGTTPGAGAEISEVVPAGAVWRLMSIKYTLSASATVANRVPLLEIDDGTNVLMQFNQPSLVTAALNHIFYWTYIATIGTDTFSDTYVPLPADVYLPAGFRIRTNTPGLQAGDQYTAPQYLVEEWIQT